MFKFIRRFFALILTLLFALLSFVAVVGGLTFASTEKLISGDYLMQIMEEEIPAGKVMNTIKGKDTYKEDASLAQIALEKLDPATIEKYNLTEENLDKILEIDDVNNFVSDKMEEAINAAANGEVFELKNTELVDAIRSSEEKFTEITGVEMSETHYADLEKAIADAGVHNVQYDFARQGRIEGLGEIVKLAVNLDLVMYGAAGVCFLFILLLNLKKKRRVFFYSGIVVFGAGTIFAHLKDGVSFVIDTLVGGVSDNMEAIIDLLTSAAVTAGRSAVSIGTVLLVLYVLCLVWSIVKRFLPGRK